MKKHIDIHSTLVVLSVALVAAILFLTPMEPAQAVPPWRPSLTPPPPTLQPITEEEPGGAYIELWAEFPSNWPWHKRHWQDLWTIVQWQNEAGWHNVIEWQGTLDRITIDKADCSNPLCTERDDLVTGYKRWWVSDDDLGDRPFRWQVYDRRGGRLLVTSEIFDLPDAVHRIRIVEVTLPLPYQ